MDADTYTVTAAAAELGVSPETLRRWTKQFGRNLSTSARPPKGEERRFTREDLQMLLWAKERIRDGAPWYEVDKQLPLLTPAELPTLGDVTGSRQDTANESTALDVQGRFMALIERLADSQGAQERQQAELGQVRNELAELRNEHAKLKAMLDELAAQPGRLTFWDRLTGRKPPA